MIFPCVCLPCPVGLGHVFFATDSMGSGGFRRKSRMSIDLFLGIGTSVAKRCSIWDTVWYGTLGFTVLWIHRLRIRWPTYIIQKTTFPEAPVQLPAIQFQ